MIWVGRKEEIFSETGLDEANQLESAAENSAVSRDDSERVERAVVRFAAHIGRKSGVSEGPKSVGMPKGIVAIGRSCIVQRPGWAQTACPDGSDGVQREQEQDGLPRLAPAGCRHNGRKPGASDATGAATEHSRHHRR